MPAQSHQLLSWGILLPWHICWRYYYDPRCLRGSSSNLAMICVPSVMILAFILESIPWCYLVVGILLLGSEPEIHPTYFMLIVFASSFRILVIFALFLEVCGISFFQIPWTAYGRSSSLNRKITTRVLLRSSPFIIVTASSTFLHGLSGRNMLKSFDMLIHASTTRKIICSFELSLFSCILTLVYQLIARSSYAFVFTDAYYSCGLSSHSIPEWLGETNSSTSSISRIGSKQLCSANQILIQAFGLFDPEVLPTLC